VKVGLSALLRLNIFASREKGQMSKIAYGVTKLTNIYNLQFISPLFSP
jgi:hypothetical protein